jgi:hypothetical protein
VPHQQGLVEVTLHHAVQDHLELLLNDLGLDLLPKGLLDLRGMALDDTLATTVAHLHDVLLPFQLLGLRLEVVEDELEERGGVLTILLA